MKYFFEVVKYDENLPGKVLMQHKPGKRCDTSLHWHKELEFVYMINGELDVRINGNSFQITDNEFYFCNSEEIHITNAPDKSKVIKYVVILLSYEYLRPFCKKIDNINFIINNSAKQKLIPVFKEIIKYAESDDPYKTLNLNSAMLKIYHILLSECSVYKKNAFSLNVPEKFIYAKKIIEYIGKNYVDDISLKEMADMVGLTPAYFSQYFKSITETSPIQYLNLVRLDHALFDMLNYNESVTQASLNNGFASVKAFIEICKKVYGCTPTQYKKRYINNSQ